MVSCCQRAAIVALVSCLFLAGCGDSASTESAADGTAATTTATTAPKPAATVAPAPSSSAPTPPPASDSAEATTPDEPRATNTTPPTTRTSVSPVERSTPVRTQRLPTQRPSQFAAGTPARAVADYADAWRRSDFDAMASQSDRIEGQEEQATSKGIGLWAFARKIGSFRLGTVDRDGTDATVMITVELARTFGDRPPARLAGPMQLQRVRGTWLVNPSSGPTLRRVR